MTQRGHHGNAILSRFPITAHTNTNIAWMKGASRSILEARIEVPEAGRAIHVMCIHMGLFGIERQAQIGTLEQRIGALDPATGLVIAGDFNDWTEAGHQVLMKRGDVAEISQSLNGRLPLTFPARLPLLAMDRIYVRHLRPVSVEAPATPSWRSLSDHLPLLAVVEIPDQR